MLSNVVSFFLFAKTAYFIVTVYIYFQMTTVGI